MKTLKPLSEEQILSTLNATRELDRPMREDVKDRIVDGGMLDDILAFVIPESLLAEDRSSYASAKQQCAEFDRHTLGVRIVDVALSASAGRASDEGDYDENAEGGRR